MNQTPSSIDFAALLDMLDGDKQIVTSLLSKFVEELTSDLAASAQAIVDHDTELLRQIAHRIKGCLLYTSPSPRDATLSRMPSSA